VQSLNREGIENWVWANTGSERTKAIIAHKAKLKEDRKPKSKKKAQQSAAGG
jgi:hypothetical protein